MRHDAPLTRPRAAADDTPPPPAVTPVHRRAYRVAVALTALAALQQLAIVAGLGGWLPGWQPLPVMLAAAPAWLVARPYWQRLHRTSWQPYLNRVRRVPTTAYLVGLLALTIAVWAWLQDKEPHLGHEEAVYANKAHFWLDGTPDAGWGVYRPVGLPFLGRFALAIHHDVGALRTVALLLALFTLVATYLVAARWLSPRKAVVVVVLLLSGIGFLRRMPEFLNDIGTTGLLLIVVYLLVRSQERPDSRALYALPWVVLAAFYLRYGVVGNLLAIAVAALLVYGPRAWLTQGRRLACAAGILLAGLLPHLVYAAHLTGSPLGLVFYATDQANRSYIGDGLVYYLAIFPYRLAGDLGAVVMAAGLVATAVAIRRLLRTRGTTTGRHPHDQRTVFLGLASLLICVVLGFATDGEPRFIYLPLVLLTILGVQALSQYAAAQAPRVLALIAGLAALTVLGTAQVVTYGAMPGPDRLSDSTVPVARQLAQGDGPRCLLVTGYEPEMGWYSGCDAVTYGQYHRMSPPPPGTRIRLVLFERGRYQPSPTRLKRLIGDRDTDVRTFPTHGTLGTAKVISLR